jgi:hypothetical protein
MRPLVTQEMLDALVAPEHQYKEAKDAPLDPIIMAWPFKTEEEQEVLRKWLKDERVKLKKKTKADHINAYGSALF